MYLGPVFGRWFVVQFVAMSVATLVFMAVSPVYHRWRRSMKNGGPLYAEPKQKKERSIRKETVEDAQRLMKQHMHKISNK